MADVDEAHRDGPVELTQTAFRRGVGPVTELLRGAEEIATRGGWEEGSCAAQEARRGAVLVDEHGAHRVIRERGGARVLRVGPASVIAQRARP